MWSNARFEMVKHAHRDGQTRMRTRTPRWTSTNTCTSRARPFARARTHQHARAHAEMHGDARRCTEMMRGDARRLGAAGPGAPGGAHAWLAAGGRMGADRGVAGPRRGASDGHRAPPSPAHPRTPPPRAGEERRVSAGEEGRGDAAGAGEEGGHGPAWRDPLLGPVYRAAPPPRRPAAAPQEVRELLTFYKFPGAWSSPWSNRSNRSNWSDW